MLCIIPPSCGLTDTFQSAERLGKVRKKTLEAFENMAEIIEDVRDSGDMFPDDQPLHLRKSAVYACLARGLENILKFFMQSAISEKAHARPLLFRG
ncbi:hypothetical protein EV356DRAFT_505331 [Viridothelium virens]|uniref:Uncharacterized protein n=1 Tax=Viridothelium virens TaxID=1048519 RepID=A0A6A6H3C8_VIRVR|nr:hypothetical protein EV356DRAFT_505331 [Viridothelium virens]